ncbi:MAG TPA: aminofutalosine synthase MqnE [Candidatus Omnitrophota bacterium]|nr:aminofutalosine synthase MqnE [Candidatus Omnitrophota bacterium]
MKQNLRSLQNISQKVQTQQRLSFEDGLRLFQNTDILTLGKMAQSVRERLHGRRVFYSVNLHLNHTNICSTQCDFCAFSRDAGASDAYALTLDEVEHTVREAVDRWHINEVHIVGGHHPDLGFDYYLEMIQRIRGIGPAIYIKAFSATEIHDIAKRAGLSVEEVLRQLKSKGLDGLPGGGAEIFDPEVRRKLCPQKISGEEWIAVHRTAHRLGLQTNATMLYGHLESDAQRVEHLLKLRELQDETHGFFSFVPLAYHPGKNAIKDIHEASGFLDLKILSISRLLLDNIPHIKVHWAATDLKFAQVALSFGADDMGGTHLDERVMHEAGSRSPRDLSADDLVRLIKDAGFESCLVNSSYQIQEIKGVY